MAWPLGKLHACAGMNPYTGAGRGRTVDLVSGKVPVDQAVAALGS